MIEKLLDNIDGNTVMELINAVTFDAKWESRYYEHNVEHDVDFTAADGSRQKADMLCSLESYYLEDDGAKGLMKYYDGRRYAFAAIMPDEGVSLNDYIKGLTAEKLNSILSNAENITINSKIPKFSYDYSVSLSENILPDMGMVTPFIDGVADFSGLNDADDQLHISEVFHKTFIKLDEEGTKAAAVTEVALADNCAPVIEKEVILDRPFLYCIVDTEGNIPVFIGTLTSLD
jgi:serpin B